MTDEKRSHNWPLIVIVVLCGFLSGCGDRPINIHDDADQRLSKLKSPVILIGKYQTLGAWSSVVVDSCGRVESFGNITILGQSIGESRHIGDTIK
jgi:hypothetical protein